MPQRSARRTAFLALVLLPVALLAAQTAAAQTAAAIPPVFRVPPGRAGPTTLSIVWRTTGGPPASSMGGNVVLQNPQQTVLQTLPPLPAQGGAVATFPETIRLSASDLQAAAQQGVRTIKVVRQFDIGAAKLVPFALVEFTQIGADFAVSRIQLRLEEGSPLRLVPRGSNVSAWADLSYAGSGVLEALWELAEPASSSGVPVYRPLRRVRRPLGAGGRVSLPAPALATDQTGLHLVRLRVLDPVPSFDVPTLRYYVAPEGRGPFEPVGIVVGEPAHLALLDADTVFTWRPLQGATAYRVEFRSVDDVGPERYVHFDPDHPSYADVGEASDQAPFFESGQMGPPPVPEVAAHVLDEPPLSGVLVPGAERSARLGPTTLRHLEPGKAYIWVVRALGEGGIPIGVSAPRLVRISAD